LMENVLEGDVTHALREIRSGDVDAKDRLARLIYGELRRMAANLMRRERPDHTFQPSDLAGEAFLRLEVSDAFSLAADRRHLFGSAGQAMWQILVDHARRRAAAKRGGTWRRVPLDAVLDHFEGMDLDLLSLHDALDQLAARDERLAQVVISRFFGGYQWNEIGEELGVSAGVAESKFRFARAWLQTRMRKDNEP
jgi:RNA polymerase sigma factor (TIGR02999 family)